MANQVSFTFDDPHTGSQYVFTQSYDDAGHLSHLVLDGNSIESEERIHITVPDAIALAKWILREFGEGK